jgi:hypothetical protein
VVKLRSRSLVTAIGSTVFMLLFGLSVCALAPSFSQSLGAHYGRGTGVEYTFDAYKCVGSAAQLRKCSWVGTVRSVNDTVAATNVGFKDEAPSDVKPGTTIEALWSPKSPTVAYDLVSSTAWLTALVSTVLSSLGFGLFTVLSFYWWRRVFRDSSEPDTTKNPQRRESTTAHPTESANT